MSAGPTPNTIRVDTIDLRVDVICEYIYLAYETELVQNLPLSAALPK
jgi:hypothetical protein